MRSRRHCHECRIQAYVRIFALFSLIHHQCLRFAKVLRIPRYMCYRCESFKSVRRCNPMDYNWSGKGMEAQRLEWSYVTRWGTSDITQPLVFRQFLFCTGIQVETRLGRYSSILPEFESTKENEKWRFCCYRRSRSRGERLYTDLGSRLVSVTHRSPWVGAMSPSE